MSKFEFRRIYLFSKRWWNFAETLLGQRAVAPSKLVPIKDMLGQWQFIQKIIHNSFQNLQIRQTFIVNNIHYFIFQKYTKHIKTKLGFFQ